MAGTILAVGLVCVLTVYATSLRATALSKSYEEARFIAETIMAQTLFENPEVPFNKKNSSLDDEIFKWSAKGRADEKTADVKHISVTVYFRNAGKSRSVTLITCQANMNPAQKPNRNFNGN